MLDTGTRQVTPREIRAVLDQMMERLDSKNGIQNLIDIRRMLAGRESRLPRQFVPTIGDIEGDDLLALITGPEIEDDPLVREMVMRIPPTPAPHYVHLEAVSVRELGLDVDGLSPASFSEVWSATMLAGVSTQTPAAVAPSMLRCIVTDKNHYFRRVAESFENLYILMEPMQCSDETRRIFRIGHGYVPHKLSAYQYFLWTRPVDTGRFNGDEFFAVMKKVSTPDQWAADRAKSNI